MVEVAAPQVEGIAVSVADACALEVTGYKAR
jgi:hypothetical protein